MSHVHAYVPLSFYIFVYYLVGAFLIVSLPFPLSLFLALITSWHPNLNLLRPRTLFLLGHLLPLILLLLMFGFLMIKPERTFWRTFLDEAFIRNAKSSYWIFPILTYPLSSTIGVGSHCVAPRLLVPLWSFGSFTPTCTDSILLYLISFLIRGTRIVVTLDIVSEVLHIPRVAHPDYLSCNCLRTVSKDELSSLFCETPSS